MFLLCFRARAPTFQLFLLASAALTLVCMDRLLLAAAGKAGAVARGPVRRPALASFTAFRHGPLPLATHRPFMGLRVKGNGKYEAEQDTPVIQPFRVNPWSVPGAGPARPWRHGRLSEHAVRQYASTSSNTGSESTPPRPPPPFGSGGIPTHQEEANKQRQQKKTTAKSSELAGEAKEKAGVAWEKTKDAAAEVKGTIVDAAAAAKEKAKEAMGAIEEKVHDASEKVQDATHQAKDKAKHKAKQSTDVVKEKIGAAPQSAREYKQGVEEAVEVAREAAQEGEEDMTERLNKRAREAKRTVKETFEQAKEKAEDLQERTMRATEELKTPKQEK